MAIGAVISIQQRLPYEFGGHGDPGRVAADFFTGGGTAAAPPFPVMVILAVLGILAAFRSQWAAIAVALAGLSGVVGAVGYLGEPHTWRVLAAGSFEPGWSAFDVVTIVVLVALVGSSGLELRDRFRNRWRRVTASELTRVQGPT
jgi:hypothetical protein